MLSIQGGRTGRIAYLDERLVATARGAILSDGDTPADVPHVIRYQGSPSQTNVRPALFMIPAEPLRILWIILWISPCK